MTVDGLILDLDISGLQDATADLEAYPQWLGKEMTVAMESGLNVLEDQVQGRTPVGVSGNLRDSITHQILSPWPNLVGRVFSPLPYHVVVEKGRGKKKGPPPADAIRQWAFRKLGLSGDELDKAVDAIRWHIHHHGIEGTHMFEEGLKASEPHIKSLFDSAIARATQRFNQS